MTRSDIRTRVRDYLYEATASVWSDAQINRLYEEETRALPTQGIYIEELWTTTLVVDQMDYTLPTGTIKIEKLERNDGTATVPDWNEMKGWDTYDGALYLEYRPSKADTIRGHLQKQFTVVSDDVTAIDVPDEKTEALVWGIVVRAYKMLIGYLRGNISWDSVTKPDGVALSNVQQWLRDAKKEYSDICMQYKTEPRPRDIDLVS